MSIGNVRQHGDKGSSFNYRLRVLQLLGRIANEQSSSRITMLGVNGNQLLGTVPNGYELDQVVAVETGGDAVVINLGITSGGAEISPTENVVASASNVFVYHYTKDSSLGSFPVYISSADWGTSNLNVYLLLRKIS